MGMLHGVRVLAVDSDPDTVALYQAFLRARRAEVHAATSGADAIPMVQPGWVPHAVLTHLRLGDMTGEQLARAIGQRAGRPVPAIATTSDARPNACETALASGFKRCLVKPVELDALAEAILAVVQEERSPSA